MSKISFKDELTIFNDLHLLLIQVFPSSYWVKGEKLGGEGEEASGKVWLKFSLDLTEASFQQMPWLMWGHRLPT